MWRRVVEYKLLNISEERNASIFRVKVQAKQATSKTQKARVFLIPCLAYTLMMVAIRSSEMF
jgi:hypothetical protein